MSTVTIFLVIISIYFSHTSYFKPIFVLLNAAIISLALLEYYQLARYKNFQPQSLLGVVTAIAYVISSFLAIQTPHLANLPYFILLGSLLLYFLAYFNNNQDPVGNLAITLFGIGYIAIPLTCALQINYVFSPHLSDGRVYLAYILAVTKMTDVGGYISGKILGKRKLAPHISPKKTIEGSIGGMAASLLTSLIFYYFSSSLTTTMTLWQSIWLGLVISLLSQFGDLSESILKRDAGIKDSSHLPGLGGILDMTDSLVFTLPLMYLWLRTV
jgi:phosphatidate cytidylyltransferase